MYDCFCPDPQCADLTPSTRQRRPLPAIDNRRRRSLASGRVSVHHQESKEQTPPPAFFGQRYGLHLHPDAPDLRPLDRIVASADGRTLIIRRYDNCACAPSCWLPPGWANNKAGSMSILPKSLCSLSLVLISYLHAYIRQQISASHLLSCY